MVKDGDFKKETYEGVLSLWKSWVGYDFGIGHVDFRYIKKKEINMKREYNNLIGKRVRVELLPPETNIIFDEEYMRNTWIEDLPDKKIIGKFDEQAIFKFKGGGCAIWRVEDGNCASPLWKAGDRSWDWINGYKRYIGWYVIIKLLN